MGFVGTEEDVRITAGYEDSGVDQRLDVFLDQCPSIILKAGRVFFRALRVKRDFPHENGGEFTPRDDSSGGIKRSGCRSVSVKIPPPMSSSRASTITPIRFAF
jgi:hypothetical protein